VSTDRGRGHEDNRWQQHAATAAHAGLRVDRWLAELSGLGRAGARKLLEADRVRLNGRPPPKGAVLRAGDRLEVALPEGGGRVMPNPDLQLQVVYEAPGFLVVDKPAGMHCHPLEPEDATTLVSAALARYPELAATGYGPLEPGLLHRLDYDTSGLVLFGRNKDTFEHFASSLRPSRAKPQPGSVSRKRETQPGLVSGDREGSETVRKRYLALCVGRLAGPGVHRAWLLARGARVRVSDAPGPGLRPIETSILSVQPVGPYSLVEVSVPSAARHQLRAHLASLGHPIVGDALYGGPSLPGLGRHFLHASRLSLRVPGSEARVELESPLPNELRAALDRAAQLPA
jgi:23S rRNA pseudouridine1911/1915/1917 synthase